MKVAISVIFGILTALVLVIGGYLGFATIRESKGLLREVDSLQTRVNSLKSEVAGRAERLQEEATIAAELDSLRSALQASEEGLEERFTHRGRPTSKAVISDSQKVEGIYPFKLKVEGAASAVDSFLIELQKQVPLVRFEKLEGVRKGRNLRLEATGSVRFPR